MKDKDWDAHQSLIWRHGNHKFIGGTKRTVDPSPVFQRFDKQEGTDLMYWVVGLTIVGAIAVVAVLAVAKWVS